MRELEEILETSEFFIGIKKEKISEILKSVTYSKMKYKKGEILANEDDPCTSIGAILEGEIDIERIYASGKGIVLNRLKRGDVFGEALVFSENSKYPATIICVSDCTVLHIKRDEILNLCTINKKILENFVSLLSNKVLMLNKKVKSLAFRSIREKVVDYILGLKKDQKTLKIKLKVNKEEIASYIGIPRPSLSRELINLKKDGIIDFDRTSITILDEEALEEELFK